LAKLELQNKDEDEDESISFENDAGELDDLD